VGRPWSQCAMMNQYRLAMGAGTGGSGPGRRLAFTSARRGLVGDVNVLQRIFDFLERWGLINWNPVGWCRLTLSKPVLKAPLVSVLEATI